MRRLGMLCLVVLLLAGCDRIFIGGGTPPAGLLPTPLASPTPEDGVMTTPATTVTPQELPTVAVTTLRVWLPPQFAPDTGSRAAELLRARLEEFSRLHADVRLEVRVKTLDGPGGLLDALSTASAAAPLALPDLVAIPRSSLESAALKGLLYPFDDLTPLLEQPDWYEYARQLARLHNSTFGVPFAGDALLAVYRLPPEEAPPRDWNETLVISGTLAFPAADAQSLFSLALYLAAEGPVSDEQGRPDLDADTLARVLTFYQQAEQAGLMPFWLTQYETYDQVWQSFHEGQSQAVVAWASRYLSEAGSLPVDGRAAPIPTETGSPFTLATGWVWALASPQPERQALSVELVEFLVAGDFLGRWTEAAGYLPPHSAALLAWRDTPLRSTASQLALSASLYPSADILSSLGPALKQAIIQVLKEQNDPANAAQSAVEWLKSP